MANTSETSSGDQQENSRADASLSKRSSSLATFKHRNAYLIRSDKKLAKKKKTVIQIWIYNHYR